MENTELIPWRIWTRFTNKAGKIVSAGVSAQTYAHKSSAVRAARNRYRPTMGELTCEWVVSKGNPWMGNANHPDARHRLLCVIE